MVSVQVDYKPQVFRAFFQLLQYTRQLLSFSADRAALMTKDDLTFPAFPQDLRISQLNSAFAVSFYSTTLESSLTVA